MRSPFTPHHVKLLQACYPPSSVLTTGSECNPNSQELSRLAYFGTNNPGKLAKLTSELEKRCRLETSRARNGNVKARVSLLLSLTIFKTLAAECRNDIALITPNLVSVVHVVLSAFPHDLELIAKVTSLFTVWTTYTDGQLIGVDPDLTTTYKTVLEHYVALCRDTIENRDSEYRDRRRFLGITALTGVVTSEALYHSTSEFAAQVSIIIPSLLRTLKSVDIGLLTDESSSIKQQPSISPFVTDFPQRPLNERRAVSIHIHLDDGKGPSNATVINTALHAMHTLLNHSNARQISEILQAIFQDAEKEHWWNNHDFCPWLALALIDWLPYQHRYMVARTLLDHLTSAQDTSAPPDKHLAITSMIETVFTSPVPLVNLSTSDMLSCLLSLLIRHATIDPTDNLLNSFVKCVSALGTHIYYQDQMHDLTEQLIRRLVSVQMNGIQGRGRTDKDPGTDQGLRCLLASLKGLFVTADKHDSPMPSVLPADKALSISPGRQSVFTVDGATSKPCRRTRVPPEVWQDSLALLYEVDYGVRSEYASTLLWFVCKEIVEEPFALMSSSSDSDDTVIPRRPTPAIVTLNSISRFLNALHAAAFYLATSPSLGSSLSPSASVHSSNLQLPYLLPAVNVTGATPNGSSSGDRSEENLDGMDKVSLSQTEQSHIQEGRPSFSSPGPRFRKPTLPLNLLERCGSRSNSPPAATLSDYIHLSSIITSIHERLPGHALLAGVPMLLSLQSFATHRTFESNDFENEKKLVVLELTNKVWETIGRVWECEEIIATIKKIKASFPVDLLSYRPMNGETELRERPIPWSFVSDFAENFNTYCIDPELAIQALAANRNAQVVTGLDRQHLLRRLGQEWSIELALKDSIEQPSKHDSFRSGGVSPFTKFSPALMHIENLSLQSLAKTQHAVGATDLREALEGRTSSTNLGLSTRPSSIRTLDQSALSPRERLGLARTNTHRGRSRSSTHVQDMLDKLGIGKDKTDRALKASFQISGPNKNKPPLTPPFPA